MCYFAELEALLLSAIRKYLSIEINFVKRELTNVLSSIVQKSPLPGGVEFCCNSDFYGKMT